MAAIGLYLFWTLSNNWKFCSFRRASIFTREADSVLFEMPSLHKNFALYVTNKQSHVSS